MVFCAKKFQMIEKMYREVGIFRLIIKQWLSKEIWRQIDLKYISRSRDRQGFLQKPDPLPRGEGLAVNLRFELKSAI